MSSLRVLCPLLLLMLVGLVTADAAHAQENAGPVTLPATQQFDIGLPDSTQAYRVFVAVPRSAPPPEGYPVLYVLDANAVFGTAAEAMRIQDMRRGLGAVLIVGVGYLTEEPFDIPRRLLDLTAVSPPDGIARGRATGGADAFLHVLQEQIRPAIEAAYPVNRLRQTLAGHSLGGLFTLHVLYTRPDLFQRYVVASPSLWWSSLESEFQHFAAQATQGSVHADVLVTVGSLEQSLSPAEAAQLTPEVREERAEQLRQRAMVDRARALTHRLGNLPGLNVRFAEFEGETHLTALGVAMSRAVRFALLP